MDTRTRLSHIRREIENIAADYEAPYSDCMTALQSVSDIALDAQASLIETRDKLQREARARRDAKDAQIADINAAKAAAARA